MVVSRHDAAKAELHAWVESKQSAVTANGRTASTSSLGTTTRKHTCEIDSDIFSLHALASGEVLASHDDGSYSIISPSTGSGETVTYSVSRLSPSSSESLHTHHISVHDRGTAGSLLRPLITGSTKDVVGVVVHFVSKRARVSGAGGSKIQKKKKEKGKRMSAMEVIDAAEDGHSTSTSMGQGHITMRVRVIRAAAPGVVTSGERSVVSVEKQVQDAFGIEDAGQVVDLAFHHHGRAVALTRDGVAKITIFSTTVNKDIGSTPASALHLPALSKASSHSTSLQLLTATYLLVVASLSAPPTPPAHLLPKVSDAVSLLIDVDLSAVLSEQVIDVSLEQNVEAPASHFCSRIGGSMALVGSVPSNRLENRSRKGVSLWTLPFEVPEGGSQLLWAMGKSDLTRKWTTESASVAPAADQTAEKDAKTTLVEQLRVLSKEKGSGEKMDETYSAWWKTQHGLAKREATFTHMFVSEILASTLPPASASSTAPFGKRTVHHLLSSGAVSKSMYPDLIASLEAQNDWAALLSAMANVSDIGEFECTRLLSRTLHEDSTPGLEKVLAVIVRVPFSRPVFRRALRDEIHTQEEVSALLDQCCGWLSLLTSHGSSILGGAAKEKVPELEDVLLFLTDLFDAHFPLLLSTPSLSGALAQVKAAIDDHLKWVDVVGPLRGPLGAFAKLEDDQTKRTELLESRKRVSGNRSKKTWVSNMDQGKEARISKRVQGSINGPKVGISETGGGLGVIRRPGEGDGGEGGKSARIQRIEASALMGPYVREKFYL